MDTQKRQITTTRVLQSILFALLFITFTSCKEGGSATGPDPGPPEEPQTFEEVIALGGETDEFPESRTTDTLAVSEPVADDREVEENANRALDMQHQNPQRTRRQRAIPSLQYQCRCSLSG